VIAELIESATLLADLIERSAPGDPVAQVWISEAQESLDRLIDRIDADMDLREGWVTIDGTHVFINNAGEITKGPASMIGKQHTDLHKTVSKSDKAKLAYRGGTKAEQDIAEETERELAAGLGMEKSPDNKPFDLFTKKVGAEVKTLTSGLNDKITMKAEAIANKDAGVKSLKLKSTYTIVVDKRPAGIGTSTGETRYFVRAGYGSFRVGSMTQVADIAALSKFMKL
jgi:hypothetical protein